MSAVLYIDDETDILELAVIYFADKGIALKTAVNARDGIALLAQGNFSVVISDGRMPGLNGLELYDVLRKQHGYRGHFILVSGHYSEDDDLPKLPGISYVLTKPIDFDDLIVKVRALLDS